MSGRQIKSGDTVVLHLEKLDAAGRRPCWRWTDVRFSQGGSVYGIPSTETREGDRLASEMVIDGERRWRIGSLAEVETDEAYEIVCCAVACLPDGECPQHGRDRLGQGSGPLPVNKVYERARGPQTYNHTREDSPLLPCALCAGK